MKTHCTLTSLFAVLALLLTSGASARAQGNAQEAADMLRALNIQIGQAKLEGNDARVSLLQNRYLDIQRKWGVRPSPGPRRPAPAPEPPRAVVKIGRASCRERVYACV